MMRRQAEDNAINPAIGEEPIARRCRDLLKCVTVEPSMWFYMMAFMITSVVEQAFFVHKACTVDHGYPEEFCRNLNKNTSTEAKLVQITVSKFHQWNNIAGHVVPIILALFFGNWSDRRGRKMPLLLGLTGKFLYSFMVVVNSLIPSWDLNMIIYTATLPMAMLGGDVAIFASCFAYISDVSSPLQRTLRITVLDVVYLSTMPTGIALGSYLYNDLFNFSFTVMFAVNASLLLTAIIYSLVRLDWQTSSQQQSLRGINIFADFFDKKHVTATVITMTKRRAGRGRLHLWLLMLAMALYTFQRDENSMSYLYTALKFNWGVAEYSEFRTVKSALFVVAMLVGIPVLSKVMGIKDALVVSIGAIAHASGRVVFALADTPELFYVGVVVAALGPVVAPVLRSMASKLVPVEERGKVFAMLSVCDNAVPLFSGVLYSQLYNATITFAPSSIYWLTFATQITVLNIALTIHATTQRSDATENSESSNDATTISTPLDSDKSANISVN